MSKYNPAKSHSFNFSVTGKREFSLAIQSTNIGGVTLGETPFPTGRVDIALPGNKPTYDPLNLIFYTDEDLSQWFNLYKWIVELARSEFGGQDLEESCELTVHDSHNQPTLRIVYANCFPLMLGDLEYSIVDEEATLVGQVTMSYSHYKVINVKTGEEIDYDRKA